MDTSYHLLLVFLLAGFCSSETLPVKSPVLIFANGPAPGKPQNASAIDEAQRQIVKGIKYFLKVEISRTVCKKRDADADLANCSFQPKHKLQQTFLCNFEVWAVPWQKMMKTTHFLCLPSDKKY
ncbi:hypothetical protein PHYPO_G00181510 [Pangasianodon hypophthalmus]|uniref:Cystatin domain-containing protein n=1 Tax=Pangasianodon hypophthalmus TaxID=310915 RepID=A0A5N5PQH9_PANHP|nr:hypothetical protein PHYPO_G00181510 [Pangasianodon hypophthalmus]